MSARVDCSPDALRSVRQHVDGDTTREVGGVLVGRMRDGQVSVDAAIPALRAVGAQANVTFTHEVWDEVLTTVDRRHPGARIVGWYHSHPGFGIFLSEYDRFIHKSFFSDTGMLALVVDPKSGEEGWFGWQRGDVAELERSPGAPAADRQPARPPLRLRAGSLMVLMLLGSALFAGGYALALRSVGPTDDHSALATARAEAALLAAKVDALQNAARRTPPPPAPPPPPPSTPQPAGAVVTYTVHRGDSLWKIAAFFYGRGSAYGRIVAANDGLKPGDLEAGSTLRIPLRP